MVIQSNELIQSDVTYKLKGIPIGYTDRSYQTTDFTITHEMIGRNIHTDTIQSH